MHSLNRRQILAGAAGMAASLGMPHLALAQDGYPNKPIRVIVPLPAGGAADATARLVAVAMQEQMKQPLVIDNKPGGIFTIGMQTIATAPADGYTLIHLNTGMAAAQASMRKIDLLKTLTPISLMGTMPTLLVTSAKAPFASMQELIAFGKANPGKLNYGSVGLGTMEHLWTHNLFKSLGIEAVHVPFKGMPDAATAVVQNEVQFVPMVYAVAHPFVQKGMLRALGVSTQERVPAMPEVPSLKDLGIKAPTFVFWGGFAAPAGTPPVVLERLRRETATALANPDVAAKLRTTGTTPQSSEKLGAFAELIQGDLDWMQAAVKSANLQLN